MLFVAATGCTVPQVIRHPLPDSTFPIASAVEMRGDLTTFRARCLRIDATPGNGRPAICGADTKTQTVGTLRSIETTLAGLGLTMSDVTKMQVFVVGDPAQGGRTDFAGFMAGYIQFFGTTEQPNLPSRSVFQVVGLANPAWFVEIKVVALRGP